MVVALGVVTLVCGMKSSSVEPIIGANGSCKNGVQDVARVVIGGVGEVPMFVFLGPEVYGSSV